MARETKKALIQRAGKILQALRDEYGPPRTALRHRDPWQLLVATILSAQCTDVRVNEVTPAPGFFHNKAKAIRVSAQQIVADFDGKVPETMDELTSLRGVARKTASVVLQAAIRPEGPHDGVVVDTHVQRLARRMGLVPSTWKNADKIERRLMEIFPREDWDLSFTFIEHGRAVCDARKPLCDECVVYDLCPRRGV